MAKLNLSTFKGMYLAALLLGSLLLIAGYLFFVGDKDPVYGRLTVDTLAQIFLAIAGSLFASFLVLYSTRTVNEVERNEMRSYLKGIEVALSSNDALACKYIAHKVPHKLLEDLVGDSGGRRYFTAVGITLTPLRDYIRRAAKIPDFRMDLVLPSTDDETLGRIAEREGRNVDSLRASIMQISDIVSNSENKAQIRLRFSNDIPNYTIIRIDEHIVWRPRVASYDGINDQFCFHTDKLTGEALFACLKRELGSIFDRAEQNAHSQ